MVDVGETAPDSTLLSDESKQASLRDCIGREVAPYFCPKDGTPGCTREVQGFRDLADEFRVENTVIIGVSKRNVKSHQKFRDEHNLPFTLLSDPEGRF